MRVASGWSTEMDAAVAVAAAWQRVCDRLGGTPSMLLVHCTVAYEPGALAAALRSVAPGVPVHGASSCAGVMTEEGFHGTWGTGLGMLGILDPRGAYGVGVAPVGTDPHAAAATACAAAIAHAGRPAEVPGLVLMSPAPGAEERLIEGIEAFFGPNVVITGGTSGDMLVGEQSFQLANGEAHSGSLAVAVLFPSTELMGSFHSGYEPTEARGRVTRAEGRTVYEIDGRPAGDVYDEWSGGLASEWARTGGGPVVADISMHPIGRQVGLAGGQPYHLLAHPKALSESRALTFMTELPVGTEVVMLRGTRDNLTLRAGRVIRSALEGSAASVSEVAGGLVVYCAGCMLTVYDRMDEVAASVRDAMEGRPFLGMFTLGEQGCFPGGENRHGNLMICATLFGR
jgi:hypothetical protein